MGCMWGATSWWRLPTNEEGGAAGGTNFHPVRAIDGKGERSSRLLYPPLPPFITPQLQCCQLVATPIPLSDILPHGLPVPYTHTHTGLWSKIAPLRVLSFDIECAGRKVRWDCSA